jgi:hypothetical protein
MESATGFGPIRSKILVRLMFWTLDAANVPPTPIALESGTNDTKEGGVLKGSERVYHHVVDFYHATCRTRIRRVRDPDGVPDGTDSRAGASSKDGQTT